MVANTEIASNPEVLHVLEHMRNDAAERLAVDEGAPSPPPPRIPAAKTPPVALRAVAGHLGGCILMCWFAEPRGMEGRGE